ncbi:hypothetical protein RHMOL_Rhmol06G0218200 [Rhododendron molle]|uniref:Uncharacterized protein n=1 Tax=Rhododendron molle TaxID=49168 RepID=A0ACC0NF22_RHOML|nr:hypothetical protein RHMOL_Rhmol06G0218200 [Rhododendron molle]
MLQHTQFSEGKMAYEMHGMLIGVVSMTMGEKVMPAYEGGSESFLNNVVTPIYTVILEEAMKSKNGTADCSTWRNYDDLNEYFWSPDCFEIGWPMRLDHNFFFVQKLTDPKVRKGQRSNKDIQEKKNEPNLDEAVEAMIIMASHELESPFQVFDATILEDIMSIFITLAILKLIQGTKKENVRWGSKSEGDYQPYKHVQPRDQTVNTILAQIRT